MMTTLAGWRRSRFTHWLLVDLAGYEKALAAFFDLVTGNIA
jgi:hypothetical protein